MVGALAYRKEYRSIYLRSMRKKNFEFLFLFQKTREMGLQDGNLDLPRGETVRDYDLFIIFQYIFFNEKQSTEKCFQSNHSDVLVFKLVI
jgi:hypothetical protein